MFRHAIIGNAPKSYVGESLLADVCIQETNMLEVCEKEEVGTSAYIPTCSGKIGGILYNYQKYIAIAPRLTYAKRVSSMGDRWRLGTP